VFLQAVPHRDDHLVIRPYEEHRVGSTGNGTVTENDTCAPRSIEGIIHHPYIPVSSFQHEQIHHDAAALEWGVNTCCTTTTYY